MLAHGGEEPLEGFDGSLFAYPEKAGNAQINVVDQGEVLMPFGILNLIDADSVDLAKPSVFQTPGDDTFDRVEDIVPGGAKGLRRLSP